MVFGFLFYYLDLHTSGGITLDARNEAQRPDEKRIQELTREHVLLSWTVQGTQEPLVVARGKGCYFWDLQGRKYLDFSSQAFCLNAGFGNEKIIDAIKSQLDVLPFCAEYQTTKVKAEYCGLVADVTPKNLTKTMVVASGAAAVENARFSRYRKECLPAPAADEGHT